MDLVIKSLVGLFVGTLIGMTGVGGGVLLLPILIFGLGVPPLRAVGSDALFNFVTKIGASAVHLRRGTVRRKVVLALALGSAPGSYFGVTFLIHLRNVYGNGVNRFITIAVGVLLICIPTFLFIQKKIEDRAASRPRFRCSASQSGRRGGMSRDSLRKNGQALLARWRRPLP